MIRRKASFDISNVGTIIAGHFLEILLRYLAQGFALLSNNLTDDPSHLSNLREDGSKKR